MKRAIKWKEYIKDHIVIKISNKHQKGMSKSLLLSASIMDYSWLGTSLLIASLILTLRLVKLPRKSNWPQLGKYLQISNQSFIHRIISHPNLLMGAFEDKMVRLFDKTKMTSCFKAHDDSVTSIATTANMN